VDAASRAIGCDASYVALPLLTALAAAIGNSRSIRLKRGWTEPAVIWSAIVGESGTLKSPALDAPLQPIRRRQAEALQRYRVSLEAYETERRAYQAAQRRRGRKNSDEPESAEPSPPVCERYWVSDVTVEALAVRLADAPRGLLLVRDELAGWIGSFGQYKGGKGADSAHWLTMHGARDLLVDRKVPDHAGRTTIYVPRAALSITGGIQPGILRTALAREHYEDGLAARLLLAMSPRRPKRWSEVEVHPDTESALADIYDRLYALELPVDPVTDEPRPIALPLSRDGKDAWVSYYDEHAREQAELTGDLAAAWSKLEGYSARLALVVHLVRVAAGDATADPSAVDAASIMAGVTLSRWHGQEAQRVYAALCESDEERERRELVELIERRGGSITVRELMWSSRRYRDSADEAEQVLEALRKAGVAVREMVAPDSGRGWMTATYRLVTDGDGDTHAPITGIHGGVSPSPLSPAGTDSADEPDEPGEEVGEWTA
jgi:hypothetical protein